MALSQTTSYFDLKKDPEFKNTLKRSQLRRIGPNTTDLWAYQYAPLWIDSPSKPSPYANEVIGPRTLNTQEQRVEQVNTWIDISAAEKREHIRAGAKAQIPNWTLVDVTKQPLRDLDIVNGAARWHSMNYALAATIDADLDTFDNNLDNYDPDPAFLKLHLPKTVSSVDNWAVGSIQMSLLATPPSSLWRLADGSDCTGTAYATATSNNTLPDLRGAYLRMAGQNGNPKWNGGSLGDWQEDHTALPHTPFTTHTAGNHYHSLGWYDQESEDIMQQYYNNTASNPSALAKHMWKREDPGAGNQAEGNELEMATSSDGNHTHTITGGDTETRPKTYCVNYFIKVD